MNKKLIRLTESDLHRIVKESVGKILKEMDLNPRMSTHDAYGRGLSRKSDTHTWSRQRRRPMTQQQNLGGVNVDAVNKVIFPDKTPQMAKDQLKRAAQNALMNPPSVKESMNKTLDEDTKDYNQVMSVLNKPIWQEKLKKAWEKEILTNPNPDWDAFEYNFALLCLDKEREEYAKHYYKMRKIQRQLDNNTRKNV